MYLIILIHELGHIVMALIFSYKIKKINIYPFGGYTIIENDINVTFISEFMVFLGGILFQTIFFMFSSLLLDNTTYIYKLIKEYNLSILIFNLLPVFPLDGSKVLNIVLNKILPFKKAHLLTIYVSYIIALLILSTAYKVISFDIMFILLIILIIKEHKNHKYIYNMFLLERYIKEIKFKKINFINKLEFKYIKKYNKNIFINHNKYVDEKELLKEHYGDIINA